MRRIERWATDYDLLTIRWEPDSEIGSAYRLNKLTKEYMYKLEVTKEWLLDREYKLISDPHE